MTTPVGSASGFHHGDVVLVPFPFSDLSGTKPRPAIVLSEAGYYAATPDVIVVQVTGNTNQTRLGDYLIANWQGAGLLAPSVVRTKIATLHRSQIHKTIGRLTPPDLQAVEQIVRTALGL